LASPTIRILGYLKPYKRITAIAMTLLLVSVSADLVIPTLHARTMAALMIGVAFLGTACAALSRNSTTFSINLS
jgi:ABC-type multidrug transport system fused ATPase/permease subunit